MTNNTEIRYILSLSELKEIIEILKNNYNIDLSFYPRNILKHRIEVFLTQYNINSTEGIKKLLSKDKIILSLQKVLAIDTTGIFRDIELWVKLKDKINKSIYDKINVWVPEVTTDDELFSIIIFLEEQSITNYKITATSANNHNFSRIKKYTFNQKKIDTFIQSYYSFCQRSDGLKYFETNINGLSFKNSFLNKVNFVEQSVIEPFNTTEIFDLILFRNRMLYYETILKEKILTNVVERLAPSGLLIIGLKETIATPTVFNLVELDKDLKIYKKKN